MQIGRELDPCWRLSCCPHPPLESPHPSWFHFALHIWFNKTPFNSVTPKNMMTNIYFKEKKTFLKKVLNQFFYCFLAHVEYPFRMWISWFCAAANKHDIFKYMLNVSSDSELQNLGCLVDIFSGMWVDIFASKLTRLTCFTLHRWRLGRRLGTQPLGCTTWGKAKGLNTFSNLKIYIYCNLFYW